MPQRKANPTRTAAESDRRVFFLTGCAGGIGSLLARHLLERQDRVVLTDLDATRVRRAVGISPQEREGALVLALDVRSPKAWEAAFRRAVRHFGRVDVLCNIAGFLRPGHIWNTTPEDIALHLDVNVRGVTLGTRIASIHMIERGSGHIINIASLAGLSPVPGLTLYAASKFAVRGLSLSAHEELADRGVALTVVCPGAVRTPMLKLQETYAEAALTFSGPQLEPEQVVAAILDAVERRPREVTLPASFGLTARIVGAFPGLGRLFKGILLRRGRAAQAKALIASRPTS